jgi:hypothetical protein
MVGIALIIQKGLADQGCALRRRRVVATMKAHRFGLKRKKHCAMVNDGIPVANHFQNQMLGIPNLEAIFPTT